jgi:hypothetical protein
MKLGLGKPSKLLLGAGIVAGVFAVDTNGGSSSQFSLVTPAHAIIGRPLTPMSYAGVARRSTYRAVGYGAVGYGAAAYGAALAVRPVVVAPAVYTVQPTCFDTVDAYGVVTRVCR